LVTGASGLLGRKLVNILNDRGIGVLAHYFSQALCESELLLPLQGDLSSSYGVKRFWQEHQNTLSRVDYFFSNYGPMTYKKTQELEFEDFERDFCAHLAPLIFLVKHLRQQGHLRAVMASGMLEAKSGKGYRHVLAHAVAKLAVETVVESWKQVWPDLRAVYWPIPPLIGARFPHPGREERAAEWVALEMVNALIDEQE